MKSQILQKNKDKKTSNMPGEGSPDHFEVLENAWRGLAGHFRSVGSLWRGLAGPLRSVGKRLARARRAFSECWKPRGEGSPGIFDVFRPGWRGASPLPRRASPLQARGRKVAFEALFPKGGASKGIPAPPGLRGELRPWPAEGGRKNRALRESPFNGSRYLRE